MTNALPTVRPNHQQVMRSIVAVDTNSIIIIISSSSSSGSNSSMMCLINVADTSQAWKGLS
jgi:hypothetical protein